jgi:hypothetical protein
VQPAGARRIIEGTQDRKSTVLQKWKLQSNIMYKDALHSAEVNDGGYRGNGEGRLYARARSACCLFEPDASGRQGARGNPPWLGRERAHVTAERPLAAAQIEDLPRAFTHCRRDSKSSTPRPIIASTIESSSPLFLARPTPALLPNDLTQARL